MDHPTAENIKGDAVNTGESAAANSNDAPAVDTPESGPHTAAAAPVIATAEGRLKELLEYDLDLKLWLEHTRFFDLAHRERVLDGIRKLKAVEEEREKLLHELKASAGGFFQSPSTMGGGDAVEPSYVSPYKALRTPSSFKSMATSANGSVYAGSSARSEGPKPPPWRAAAGKKSRALADPRYFLIKSSNEASIYMSQKDKLWVTQAKNGLALTEAFKKCKSVILFFSVNKSQSFQGFARMTSAPDPTIPKPDWIREVALSAVTEPFRVEWLNTVVTDFEEVGDLRNHLNRDRSVVIGRDGQEYNADCARRMMTLMNQAPGKLASEANARPPPTGGNAPYKHADRTMRVWQRRDRDPAVELSPFSETRPSNPDSASASLIDY